MSERGLVLIFAVLFAIVIYVLIYRVLREVF
jgi:hypothetical protein